MSEVLSIRIPKRLKRELEELRGVVDWRKEIIEFLEKRVEMYRRARFFEEAHRILEKHPTIPEGYATRSVREDRDSG